MNTQPQSPSLAPPGAGLPWLELRIARLLVGWQARRTTRQEAAALFAAQRDRLLADARALSPEVGARRVLIPRPRGLEDSSRFYSVYMVLEHLRIMNFAITDVIEQLVRGHVPPGSASTAAVKPKQGVGPETIAGIEASCDYFLTKTAALPDLRSDLRWPHPWFGPLDAERWHFFNASTCGCTPNRFARSFGVSISPPPFRPLSVPHDKREQHAQIPASRERNQQHATESYARCHRCEPLRRLLRLAKSVHAFTPRLLHRQQLRILRPPLAPYAQHPHED